MITLALTAAAGALPLQPYHPPPPPGWWPPAPGWWLLLMLILVLLAAGCYWLLRWRRRTAYRRAALQQLRRLEGQHFHAHCNRLLKQCALAAGHPVAGMTTRAWQHFLVHCCQALTPEQAKALCDGAYGPVQPDGHLETLQAACIQWIRKHPRGGLNV